MTKTELVAALRQEHPAWRIWTSNEGRFYATRHGLHPDASGQGLTVDSLTAIGLHDVISAAIHDGDPRVLADLAEAEAAAYSAALL